MVRESLRQPGAGRSGRSVELVLNSLIHHRESSADIEEQANADGDVEPSVLLCGLAGLISSGELL